MPRVADPDPHHSEKPDPYPDPYQSNQSEKPDPDPYQKSIWIRIKLKSGAMEAHQNRAMEGRGCSQMESWMLTMEAWMLTMESWMLTMESWMLTMEAWMLTMEAWKVCMPVVADFSSWRSRIRIRIRNAVKGRIRIRFKVKGRIRIRIKVKGRIRIPITGSATFKMLPVHILIYVQNR
jgi:hypothetical protein